MKIEDKAVHAEPPANGMSALAEILQKEYEKSGGEIAVFEAGASWNSFESHPSPSSD